MAGFLGGVGGGDEAPTPYCVRRDGFMEGKRVGLAPPNTLPGFVGKDKGRNEAPTLASFR